ncbi:hypothetical protein GCM10010387_04110 [Streptomyces inusitatus]|uniref:Uncharacterized protein n=1 Tax=Streptomyces inusitatus TaxID=68221 RepID=A0A918PL78_9ACTN|nr:hypothetical protein GCM10010387_04110 [Streptomyces inusitatus]
MFAAITVLSLTAVACGESKSGGDGGGKTEQQGNSAAGGDRAAALVKYSQCMRDNGVAEFPDPVDGRLRLQVQRGGPLDPENATYKSALAACKDQEPPGLAAGSGQGGDREKALLEFVSCMRKNGVKEFPDPVDGRIQLNRGPGLDPESAEFKKAEEACRQLMPGGAAPGGN